jgi:hypothetical protein
VCIMMAGGPSPDTPAPSESSFAIPPWAEGTRTPPSRAMMFWRPGSRLQWAAFSLIPIMARAPRPGLLFTVVTSHDRRWSVEVLLSTGDTAIMMRNRARDQCTPSPTNDCWNNHFFDVNLNSRDFGATPRKAGDPRALVQKEPWDHRIVSLFHWHPRSSL